MSGGSSASGGSSGFTFGLGAKKPATETASATSTSSTGSAQQTAETGGDADEDAEYQPPKPEVVELNEDDAFFTMKCKLFYMVDGKWSDRGVGKLFLKPTASGKTQLLIRAENTLGTILLNVLLSKSIPTSLQGTNNVSLSCIPNPPIIGSKSTASPVCMLLKVKTADNASELLKQLDDNKK